MTFDIQKILQSKREFRRGLVELPIEERLRLLDELRERQVTLREWSAICQTRLTNPANESQTTG